MTEKVMAVDIADTGTNLSAACIRVGRLILPLLYRASQNTMRTAGWIINVYNEHQPDYVIIDYTGIGAGVYSRLHEQGYPVYSFVASWGTKRRDRSKKLRFANLRSWCWWAMRENLMITGTDPLPLMLPPDDRLIGDLTTPRWYERSNGTIQVESKDEISKRLNRSTDAGDAAVMTLYTPPQYKPVEVKAVEVPIR